MSTVLVVVIAGVIIAAIAGATLSGGPKPATGARRRHRGPRRPRPVPSSAPPERGPTAVELPGPEAWVVAEAEPAAWSPPERDEQAWTREEPDGPGPEVGSGEAAPGEPDRRGVVARLRAALLLAVTVAVLGALAAGLVGVVVLVGYRVLDRALG